MHAYGIYCALTHQLQPTLPGHLVLHASSIKDLDDASIAQIKTRLRKMPQKDGSYGAPAPMDSHNKDALLEHAAHWPAARGLGNVYHESNTSCEMHYVYLTVRLLPHRLQVPAYNSKYGWVLNNKSELCIDYAHKL